MFPGAEIFPGEEIFAGTVPPQVAPLAIEVWGDCSNAGVTSGEGYGPEIPWGVNLGVAAFTVGLVNDEGVSDGVVKDGTVPASPGGRGEMTYVDILSTPSCAEGCWRSAGVETWSAWARATVSAEAERKRALGSLDRMVIMTIASSGETNGLSKEGEVGVTLICCESTAIASLPRKGVVPVITS